MQKTGAAALAAPEREGSSGSEGVDQIELEAIQPGFNLPGLNSRRNGGI
jgi:hypothetical protein